MAENMTHMLTCFAGHILGENPAVSGRRMISAEPNLITAWNVPETSAFEGGRFLMP